MNNETTLAQPDVAFLVAEAIVAVLCVFGNSLVAIAFLRDPRLRTVTNYYIFSLSLTDILVGLVGIPATVFSMTTGRPHLAWACLLNHCSILMLTTVSIFHLVAVSLDRYLNVVHLAPVKRTRKFKYGTAFAFILISWISGVLIGSIPLMGWNKTHGLRDCVERCEFLLVFDIRFMIFVFYSTILLPTLPLLFFYRRIYTAAATQVSNAQFCSNGATLRTHKLHMKRRVVRSLSVVILAFLICWYPLHILNLLSYHLRDVNIPLYVFYILIVVSHINSALNPAIYACMMADFKRAMKRSLYCMPVHHTEHVALLIPQVRYGVQQRCISEASGFNFLVSTSSNRKARARNRRFSVW